jgi:hypothetical protein
VTDPEAFDPVQSLILDLLEWIGPEPRPYDDVMNAWRTSCPRLPVWEDANSRGLVACLSETGGRSVFVTPAGREHLNEYRLRSGIESANGLTREGV